MAEHMYGEFTKNQIAAQKKELHRSIHWLLIYREQNYQHLSEYVTALMIRISGLNELLREPPVIITLLSILQAIKDELNKPVSDFKLYRKLVFDAHSLIDKIEED